VEYYFLAVDSQGRQTTNPLEFALNKYSFSVVPDVTPVRITKTVPENGALDVLLSEPVSVFFDDDISATTLNDNTISVIEEISGTPVAVKDIAYYQGERKLAFTADFNPDTRYKIYIKPDVRDLGGNGLIAGTASNPWTFATTKILPPAVTGIRQDREHFNSATQTLVFSADVSTPISQGTVILKNPQTQDEFRITVPIEKEAGTGRVLFKWDGKDNDGNFIPEGEYAPSFEVVDAKYGMVGNSEFQPAETVVKTRVAMEKAMKDVGKQYVSAWLNCPQRFTVHVNYEKDYDGARVGVTYDGKFRFFRNYCGYLLGFSNPQC